jgi:peptidoglycan/LPS O-acetylase OafA/YrhL
LIRNFFGLQGVELFFVLSGFLIGTILIKTYEQTDVFNFSVIKNFWKKRWFRTLPNYYLFLAVYYFFAFIKQKPLGDATYLFFLQNFPQGMSDFYDISWSLCIEEWFYLTLPLILLFFTFLKNISKQKKILYSILSYLAIGFLIRYIGVFYFNLEKNFDEGVRKVVLYRFDAIPYGVLAAYFYYYYQTECERFKHYFKIGFCILFLIFSYILVKFLAVQNISPWTALYLLPLVDVMFLCFLLGFYDIKTKNKSLIKAITFVSMVSYSMYLVHPLLILSVNQIWLKWQTPIVFNVFLFWFLTFFISYLIYVFYEKPLMDYRER